jgi:hypothetical protein
MFYDTKGKSETYIKNIDNTMVPKAKSTNNCIQTLQRILVELMTITSWVPRYFVEQELLTVSEQLGSPVFSGTGTAYCFRTAEFPMNEERRI